MKTTEEAAKEWARANKSDLNFNYSSDDTRAVELISYAAEKGYIAGFESRQPEFNKLQARAEDIKKLIGIRVRKSAPPKAMCMDCHKDYAEFGLDTVMPDDQWAIINPDINGLLCAQCIVNRASRVYGVIVVQLTLKESPETKTVNPIRLALHNIIGHPLMEIAYILGLRQIGNYIHNCLFKVDH